MPNPTLADMTLEEKRQRAEYLVGLYGGSCLMLDRLRGTPQYERECKMNQQFRSILISEITGD